MNKKLMAVAVAGALGAPALAFAQASTVQIYGLINYAVEQRSAGGGDTQTAAQAAAAGPVSSVRGGGGAAGGINNTFSATPGNAGSRTANAGSGSNFGLRGREDLGGGLYAGFQIEISIQGDAVGALSPTGSSTNSTYRNTGVWLGTGVGEFGTGMWDTPFTLNTAQVGAQSAYTNSSSSSSAAITGGLSFAQATYSGQPLNTTCAQSIAVLPSLAAGTLAAGVPAAATNATNLAVTNTFGATFSGCFQTGTSFNRRQPNSIWYQSPDWSGFKVRAQYGGSNGDATADASPNTAGQGFPSLKSSLFSITGTYTNGPLYVGLGYEKHYDMSAFAMRTYTGTTINTGAAAGTVTNPGILLGGAGATTATFNAPNMTGSNDYGWNLNGRYTFGGGFSAGLLYEKLNYSWSYDGTGSCASGVAGGGCAVSNVTGLSRNAYRVDGAFQTGPHTIGLVYTRAQELSGQLQGNTFNGTGTGVSSWVLGYAYAFSKRTALTAYYNNVTNDTNARSSGTTFNGVTPAAGGDPRYYGVGLKHSF